MTTNPYADFPLPDRPMEPRSLKDEVAKELREQLAALTVLMPGTESPEIPVLFEWELDRAVKQLLPWVLERIDHAVQLARVDRGTLPYDED